MDIVHQLVDVILHVDVHLARLAAEYGLWIYGILFLVIFCETGLVVTPFLPGDSLLFAAGAMCAASANGNGDGNGMSIFVLVPLLALAAFSGDQVNYRVGHVAGPRVARWRLVKAEYLARTESFYEKHGSKTVILARFVPIVRTFAPFVAGIGRMKYARFLAFSAAGGVLWVTICAVSGFFLGEIPVVKRNFEIVVIVVVAISVMPIGIELLKARLTSA